MFKNGLVYIGIKYTHYIGLDCDSTFLIEWDFSLMDRKRFVRTTSQWIIYVAKSWFHFYKCGRGFIEDQEHEGGILVYYFISELQNIWVLQPLTRWQQIDGIINHYSSTEKRITAINVLKGYRIFGMIILWSYCESWDDYVLRWFMITAAVIRKRTFLTVLRWDYPVKPEGKSYV